MKSDVQSSYDLDGPEAALPELIRLRRTSGCEVSPQRMQEQVHERLLASVSGQRRPTGPLRSARPLLLAAGVLMAVPAAIAASSFGAEWAERVMTYLPSYSEYSALPERELEALAAPRRAAPLTSAVMIPPPATQLNPVPEPPGGTREPMLAPSTSALQQSATPATRPASPARTPAARAASHAAAPALHGPSVASSTVHSSLQEERVILERARVRLSAGDAPGVLWLTAEHEQRFPTGLLTQERDGLATRARALLSKGNSESGVANGNME